MIKPKWLARDWVWGSFLTLVTSEEEYRAVLAYLKVPLERANVWVSEKADATTHHYHNGDGDVCAIVTFKPDPKMTGVQVAALLVHEAVHVFQEFCARIGESAPSREFEAYSIQSIAQTLMTEFAERHSKPNTRHGHQRR